MSIGYPIPIHQGRDHSLDQRLISSFFNSYLIRSPACVGSPPMPTLRTNQPFATTIFLHRIRALDAESELQSPSRSTLEIQAQIPHIPKHTQHNRDGHRPLQHTPRLHPEPIPTYRRPKRPIRQTIKRKHMLRRTLKFPCVVGDRFAVFIMDRAGFHHAFVPHCRQELRRWCHPVRPSNNEFYRQILLDVPHQPLGVRRFERLNLRHSVLNRLGEMPDFCDAHRFELGFHDHPVGAIRKRYKIPSINPHHIIT